MSSSINASFNKLSFEISSQAIEDFRTFLGDNIEIEPALNELFDEFVKTLEKTSKSIKAHKGGPGSAPKEKREKRALSSYNLFIQSEMARLKADEPDVPANARMSRAAAKWKEQRNAVAGGVAVVPVPAVVKAPVADKKVEVPDKKEKDVVADKKAAAPKPKK